MFKFIVNQITFLYFNVKRSFCCINMSISLQQSNSAYWYIVYLDIFPKEPPKNEYFFEDYMLSFCNPRYNTYVIVVFFIRRDMIKNVQHENFLQSCVAFYFVCLEKMYFWHNRMVFVCLLQSFDFDWYQTA